MNFKTNPKSCLPFILFALLLSCNFSQGSDDDDSGNQGDALFIPIDSEGWTDFTPSDDSRIVYVSSEGDDSRGKIYSSEDVTDPFSPAEPILAFATYEAAFSQTREGYPDWILYRRGDSFHEAPGDLIRSGRSIGEPFLISSYGNSGASPLINTGTESAIRISNESPSTPSSTQYIAIQGLRFYANYRNPDDSEFTGYGDGGSGIIISTYNSGNNVHNILIEGCHLSFFRNNVIIQAGGDAGSITNVEVRRNVLLNAYSVTSHSQGLYASGVDGLSIEENIFDHNGYLIQSSGNDRTNGGATFHNHNVYTDGVQNGNYSRNIFLRSSSIGTKLQGNTGIEGLVVDNNLYADVEIGIESCNNYHDNYYRVHDPLVTNNVFYELGVSNPTLRNVGWGMWIQGWDGGEISNNLLISHQGQMFFNLGLRSRDISIQNNTGFLTSMYGIYHTSEVELLNISIEDNYFEKMNDENGRMIVSEGAVISDIAFGRNRYYSPGTVEFRIGTDTYNQSQWTTGYESSADFTRKSFPDSSRTIETYLNQLGEEATFEHFIELCRNQERYHWDTRITAPVINDWLRGGFGMEYRDNI